MFKIFDQNSKYKYDHIITANKFSEPCKSATAASQTMYSSHTSNGYSDNDAADGTKLSQFIPRIGKETNCTNIQWDRLVLCQT